MRRREFITLLGGAAVAWPQGARAQQANRMRRIGVLLGGAATDRPELAAFLQALQQLGWTDGRNLKTEVRSGLGNAADTRKFAQELAALALDVILVSGAAQNL
jgi:putative ABC transport system substrate-binding protein